MYQKTYTCIFPMLGCRHYLTRFTQDERSYSTIPNSVHLPVWVHFLALLELTFRERDEMQGHLLFIGHFSFLSFFNIPILENIYFACLAF